MTTIAPVEPGALDLICYIGLPFVLDLRWWTDSTKTTLKDLSNYTGTFVVKTTRHWHAAVISGLNLTHEGDDRVILAATNPNITVSVRDQMTTTLRPNSNAFYRLTLNDGTRDIPVMAGRFNITYWEG